MAEKPKKYKRFQYTLEALKLAVEAVQEGRLSTNKACKEFSIPKGTLINRLHGKGSIEERRMGPMPVLTQGEENKLEEWILNKAKFGFPMHEEELKDAVQKVMTESKRQNPFTDNKPGRKWVKLFLNRKKSIAKRNAEIISKARAAVTDEDIRKWFFDLEEYLEEENAIDILSNGDRIYNADETGVQLCPKTGKVLGPKEFKNFYDVAAGKEKECITVLANFSASGKTVPPMIVLPYQRIPKDVSNSIPDNYFIGRSDSGWMVGGTFFEYVANWFYPWLVENKIPFPILFLLDGHKSHINLELADFCREKGIFIYCLLPNATHILQPCDVGMFRPLKVRWRAEVQAYKQKTHKALTRNTFAPIFKKAFDKATNEITIQNAFRACGIFPFNVNNVDLSKCMNTRHKPEEQALQHNIYDARIFLKILEKEIGDKTLEGFECLHKNNTERDDELYRIWKKYKIIVSTTENLKEQNINELAVEQNLEEKSLHDHSNSWLPITRSGTEINIIQDITLKPADKVSIEFVDTLDEPVNCGEDGEEKSCTLIAQVKTGKDTNDIRDDVSIEYINTLIEPDEEFVNSENHKQESCILAVQVESERNTNNIWDKHLHYPKIENERKRRTHDRAPLAVVSKKWKQFHEQKEIEKEMKIEEQQRKKLQES